MILYVLLLLMNTKHIFMSSRKTCQSSDPATEPNDLARRGPPFAQLFQLAHPDLRIPTAQSSAPHLAQDIAQASGQSASRTTARAYAWDRHGRHGALAATLRLARRRALLRFL